MATSLGRVYLNGCNYELAYDLLGQSSANNSSNVRFYGILHVTNSFVSWSSGYASVHTSGAIPIGTYYSYGDYTVVSRDFTFTHDNQGNFSAYIGASLSTTFTSGDTGGILTLPKIIRQANMLSANNVNDEENPHFTFNNPGGYNLTASLEINPNNDHLLTRSISNTGSYTFELTDDERDLIRSYLPNSNSGVLRYLLYSNNNQFVSYLDRTYTIINANPIFNNFDFEDTNPITLDLTGDSKININGYSNIKAIISPTNKAEAIKKASMIKYRFNIDNASLDMDYSEDEVTGTINNATSGTYNIYAIDSRNNSTLVTKLATTEIPYENISINTQSTSISRNNNQVGPSAVLRLNGTFWNDNFGKVDNTIKKVSYKFKKTSSSEWIDGKTLIVPDTNENNFSFTGEIASDNEDTYWDLNESYNIRVTVSDELSSSTINLILNSAVPTMSFDKEGVGIMCAYDRRLGGYLQVNGQAIGTNDITETEKIIGKINNRNLYRKALSVSGFLPAGNSTIRHNIRDFDQMINVYGYINDNNSTSNKTQFQVTRISSDGAYMGIVKIDTSDIYYYINPLFGDNRLRDMFLVLEYIKTTD